MQLKRLLVKKEKPVFDRLFFIENASIKKNKPKHIDHEIFANEGGFEIDRNLITSVDLNTKGFVNGEDVGDAMWDQFTDAVVTINYFIERFGDVRILAEVA